MKKVRCTLRNVDPEYSHRQVTAKGPDGVERLKSEQVPLRVLHLVTADVAAADALAAGTEVLVTIEPAPKA